MTGLATPTGQNISPVGYAARTFSDFIYPKHKKWYVQRTLLFCYIPVPRFRRAYVPGGSFFFTVVTERHAPILCTDTSRIFLRTAIRECRQRWPFRIDAMVLPGNHLHAIWTLPEGDTRYSARWGWIKKEFTKAYLAADGNEQIRSDSRIRQRRRGVLHRRFLRQAQDRFGNMPCGMRKIMPGISIMPTITQLNMGTWNPCRIGLIQLSTAGSNKAFTRSCGAVRLMGSWNSTIWIRLLWNRTTNSSKNKCADYISQYLAS